MSALPIRTESWVCATSTSAAPPSISKSIGESPLNQRRARKWPAPRNIPELPTTAVPSMSPPSSVSTKISHCSRHARDSVGVPALVQDRSRVRKRLVMVFRSIPPFGPFPLYENEEMQLRRVHPWIRHAIRVIGTVGALAWIAHRLDGPSLAAAVTALPGWAFLVPVSIVMLNTLNQAIRLRWVLKVLGHELQVRTVLGCLMRGAFVGLTLPSGGGEIAKTALIGQAGPGLGTAISALVVVRITQLPSWIIVLCWGLAVGAYARTPALLVSALCFIAVAMTLLVVVTFAHLPWRDHWPWAGAVERWRDGFRPSVERRSSSAASLVSVYWRPCSTAPSSGCFSSPRTRQFPLPQCSVSSPPRTS